MRGEGNRWEGRGKQIGGERETDRKGEGKREKSPEEFFPNVRKRCMRVSHFRIPGGSRLAVALFIEQH